MAIVQAQTMQMASSVVFESLVRSSLLPLRGWTETETGLCKLKSCERPD